MLNLISYNQVQQLHTLFTIKAQQLYMLMDIKLIYGCNSQRVPIA